MIGQKISKPIEDYTEYENLAIWCNSNNAHIEDKGDYYEVIENPKPTEKELEDQRLSQLMPTAEERIEAQVMYTALMTDTLLELEEE